MKFATAISALALVASASAQTIVDVAVSTGTHTTLVDLVTQAGLVDALSGDGPLTVFAPTDDAFAALNGAADKFTTPDWDEHLTDILTYHVVDGKVMSTDLSLSNVTMLNGGTAEITSLSPAMINTATINPADVAASNGVVHVVDQVLLPTSVTSNIVDIASGASDFSTLVSLVVAADLAETLSGAGPFTVFAPTNAAFEAVDPAVVKYLTSPEGKDDLTKILTYHVFPGVVYQSDVADGEITMVSGDDATVKADPPMIENANIQAGQILANNGVIHVIDAVILPESLALPKLDDGHDHADGDDHKHDDEKPESMATAAPDSAAATASFAGVLALLFGAAVMM